jgi:C4-type Zn-finger protein
VIDYRAEYEYHHPDERVEVEDCPVCENCSLVVRQRDVWIGEVGIGQCVVCGYRRSSAIADEIAMGIQMQRAVDRSD